MTSERKLQLIVLLTELVAEEQEYDFDYQARIKAADSARRKAEDNKTYFDYSVYREYRAPNKATIKDSMKLIGRLGFQIAGGKR